MNNQFGNDTNVQYKYEGMSFGIPFAKGYNMTYETVGGTQTPGAGQVLGPTGPGAQPLLQRQLMHQYKEFEQPRYYQSSMVMQQPFVQVGQKVPYGTAQSIVYPEQQAQEMEARGGSSNYLLIPQAGSGMVVGGNMYAGYVPSLGMVLQPMQPAVVGKGFVERLQRAMPAPPLAKAPTRPEISMQLTQKRTRRKSKFTKGQDDLIVQLKQKGKSWVEIAEMSGVGSYLAARNRYQVIVGQQGNNNSSSWDESDKSLLQKLLDDAEIEKWKFIAVELNKATGKNFTDKECRDTVRTLFWANPVSFDVSEETMQECIKENKVTERANEQQLHVDSKNSYVQPFYNNPTTPHLYNSYTSKSSPDSMDNNYLGTYY